MRPDKNITRRDLIGKTNRVPMQILIMVFLSICLANEVADAQEDLNVIKTAENGWLEYADAGNSLYYYLERQSTDLLNKRASVVAGIHTLSGWQDRQKNVRKTLSDIVGPFPSKTPLNAKTIRIVNKDGFRVEQIVYESQPGFVVTSSLFIPAGINTDKAPAILYCSGHTTEGYRNKVYQHIILNLVKKGFIVFAFDPVGQGERKEYYNSSSGKSIVKGPTDEHSYPGAQVLISGSSYAKYMIWDGIRAVDFLLSRKEVDPDRIGITGRSGGGTQSAYIAAFDDRIKAAAPEGYITSFTRLLQSIGPQDAEQNLFNEIERGIDHADLLEVRAPKPTMIITTTRDFFSIQGARETAKEVSVVFNAYGKSDNFSMVEDDAPHESTKKNREAMYAFFQKYLDNPGSSKDEEIDPLNDDELRVITATRDSAAYKAETVFSINRKESEIQLEILDASRQELKTILKSGINSARTLSGYQDPSECQEPVFTGRIKRDGYVIEKYFEPGGSGYVIPYLLMLPDKPNGKGLIYLHPSGKSAEAFPGGEMEWFVRLGFKVLSPDLVGIGEMGPGNFQGDSYIDGISYNIWFASMLVGRSIVGIRAADVVRLSHLLEKIHAVNTVYGIALQEMTPVLQHASAFDTVISRIALIDPLSSYRSIVMNRFYKPGLIHSAVPGSLSAYDLQDLAGSLAPRRLLMINPTDNMGKTIDEEGSNKDSGTIRQAFHLAGADNQLNIVFNKSADKRKDYLMQWLK
jgi:hypothetical protein